jgi:hypothetical protein
MKRLRYLIFLIFALGVSAQTTEFSHQGSLKVGGSPANGNFDLEFRLFNAESGGGQVGSTVQQLNVAVANGIYAVTLDFGSGGLTGADRWLEIAIRTAGGGAFTTLTPRQKILSAPFAVKSSRATNADIAETALSAEFAGNAAALGGVAASDYVVTTDPRMTNARPPTAGSANYIQNSVNPQAASDFNISGNGTAGGRLSASVVNATTRFEIGGSRILSNAGTSNIFVGVGAGAANTGPSNSFFGSNAGNSNTSAGNNSFFGTSAGRVNTTGFSNSFFGSRAGEFNTTGENNSFFGARSGESNSTGLDNTFYGALSGFVNTTGSRNVFVGTQAGSSNSTATDNSFFGYRSGEANTTAGGNSFFGSNAGVSNTTGNANAFFGGSAGTVNTIGNRNTFIGYVAGASSTTGSRNTFLGDSAGFGNTTGSNNTSVGYQSTPGAGNLSYATSIGSDSIGFASNTIVLGRDAGQDAVHIWGVLRVGLEGSGATDVCRNAALRLSSCSSSLRYKDEVETYSRGLDVIRRLRPIIFDWKTSGQRDLGFAAEEVASIEPLLATHNDKGEIEGVKYKQLTTVLVNAVNEQQRQIDTQAATIKKLLTQVELLTRHICKADPSAEICF